MSERYEHDHPGREQTVHVHSDPRTLLEHVPAWERLVEMAAEPNAFLEPFFLLPALEHVAHSGVEVVRFEATPVSGSPTRRVLCGLLVLRRRGRFSKGDGLWKHAYSYLGTPLVRRDATPETIAVMLDWLASRGTPLFGMEWMRADGPFFRHYWAEVQERGLDYWVQEQVQRALFVPDSSSAAFQARAISKKLRKELARMRRRLAETGSLASSTLAVDAPSPELEQWIEHFITLEASGWKGRAGSAFGHIPSHATFLRTVLRAAHTQGKLMMLRVDFEGRPIAMNIAFLSGDGGFYFKIAHDEEFARYSPGLQLELDFIDTLHNRKSVRWIDSCAAPAHPMIDRLWDQRRIVQTVRVATAPGRGRFALCILPFARLARRSVRHERPTAAAERAPSGVAPIARSASNPQDVES